MDIAALRSRIALMRELGVSELQDGEFRAVLGAPPPATPNASVKAVPSVPEAPHPADLVSNPPDLSAPEAA